MTREIKFRAWDVEQKLMTHSPMMGYSSAVDLNEQIKCFQKQGVAKILMQYTGLKDKNGKEIYEGDIVYCRKGNAVIKFVDGSFIFLRTDDMHEREADYYQELRGAVGNGDIRKFEIIGNVWENPELIKQNNE